MKNLKQILLCLEQRYKGSDELTERDRNSEFDRAALDRKRILEIWTDIPEGITETFIHPALESDELKSITGNWWQRVWEYQLMKDPETEKYLNAHGVELISYRDIVKMKSK